MSPSPLSPPRPWPFQAAIRADSSRFIWPAPIPAVAPSLRRRSRWI
jgi:hypothetical protein